VADEPVSAVRGNKRAAARSADPTIVSTDIRFWKDRQSVVKVRSRAFRFVEKKIRLDSVRFTLTNRFFDSIRFDSTI